MAADVSDANSDATSRVELCIVGAGAAGLNALAVATGYLTPDQRVVIVDRRPGPGGMWIDTYAYVRLHQPYRMFTAGDIAWTLRREPDYLATRDEVLDHLTHCRDVLAGRVRLEEFYGWTAGEPEEDSAGVRLPITGPDGSTRVIEAARLIIASGFDVEPNDPLPLSSPRVRSVSPDHLDIGDGEFASDDAPVWIVGGGKTAMDTAHQVIARYPGREVNLLAGSGTFFNNRDRFFPSGSGRWWRGRVMSTMAAEVADRFDGTNSSEVFEWFRSGYGLQVTPDAGRFMLGNLSPAEVDVISAGLNRTVMDYLVDVVDDGDAPTLVLRGGDRLPVGVGSWVINCTGYLLKDDATVGRPYRSVGGRVVRVSTRAAVLHLSTYMAYFLTHLAYLDRLDVPLYSVDMDVVRRRAPEAMLPMMLALVNYNIGLIADAVPLKVFSACGLDFDKWYPMPRQLGASARFMLTRRRRRPHYKNALDTAGRTLGIPLGTGE